MTAVQLRDEALMLLEGKGAILALARRVTRVLNEHQIAGGVIGGVAVVLHGHVRTTADVDVFIDGSLQAFSESLVAAGFVFSAENKEFVADGVPVHVVTSAQTTITPENYTTVDDIRVVSLPDLIDLKLTAGLRSLTRAQDIADVIGLIRALKLTSQFAGRLRKPLRADFRKFVKAVNAEASGAG